MLQRPIDRPTKLLLSLTWAYFEMKIVVVRVICNSLTYSEQFIPSEIELNHYGVAVRQHLKFEFFFEKPSSFRYLCACEYLYPNEIEDFSQLSRFYTWQTGQIKIPTLVLMNKLICTNKINEHRQLCLVVTR